MEAFIDDLECSDVRTECLRTVEESNVVLNINAESNSFSVLHLNIRSLRKNFISLEVLLAGYDTPFDCIVLSETWVITNTSPFNLPNYTLVYNSGDINKNDGLVIYIKSELNFSWKITKIDRVNAITLLLNKHDKKISILALYRPPSIDLRTFLFYLQKHFEESDFSGCYRILVGDLNINILRQDELVSEYLNMMASYGYRPTINKPTRVQGESKTCIDHIFLKTSESNFDYILPIIIESQITDHYPCLLQVVLEASRTSMRPPEPGTTNYKSKINYPALRNKLQQVSWQILEEFDNVEAAVNKFLEIVQMLITKHTRIVKYKHKRRRKNWITPGIIESIKTRDRLYQKCVAHPLNMEYKEEHKKYRNKLNNLLRNSKASYYRTRIQNAHSSTSLIWRTAQELNGKTVGKNGIIDRIKSADGDIIDNPVDVCNHFNETFVGMGEILASKLKPSIRKYGCKPNINTHTLFLAPTTKGEIMGCIRGLKRNKAPGIDGMTSEMMQEITHEISDPLAYLMNRCMETGVCPSAFKVSVVRPVLKRGDTLDVNNYRPISLITSFAKIFENLIKSRLTSFLEKYSILYNNQYGFRVGRNTADALAELSKFIYSSMNISRPSLAVFLDLAKAFDTVSHTLLLEKLESVGIRGHAHKLLTSYLSERLQCVQIGNFKSSMRVMRSGVPQGTIIGPLLFVIYMNDLFSIDTAGQIRSFADDTVIFYEDTCWEKLRDKVQEDLINVTSWLGSNLLTINFDKTMYVPFACKESSLPKYEIITIKQNTDVHIIRPSKHFKYLGVNFDSHLRWDKHADDLVKRLRSLTFLFRSLSHILRTEELRLVYFGLVESLLRYGIIAWGGLLNVHMKKIETVQKKIIKIIYKKENTYPSVLLYRESALMDIRQIYFLELVLRKFNEPKTYSSNEHNTRGGSMIRSDVVHKTITQRSHTYLAIKAFNYLPTHIKVIKSKPKFKKTCKMLILETERSIIHSIIDMKN